MTALLLALAFASPSPAAIARARPAPASRPPAARVAAPRTLGPAALAPVRLPVARAAAAAAAGGPAAPFRMAREIRRDEMAEALKSAGLPALLAEHGLLAWHIMPHRPRAGGEEQVYLSVSLPREGRDFDRGSGEQARRSELAARLAQVESRARELVSSALGLDPSMVMFNERLIEGCCGAGCQSCLLTKSEHAQSWTGEPPRPAP